MPLRAAMLAGVMFIASCSGQGQRNEQAPASPSPTATPLLADQQDAKATVAKYFDLIAHRDYDAARKLWGNGGADTRGTPVQFARSFTQYTRYDPSVGEPTEIKTTQGKQYILVQASLHVVMKGTGRISDREGVMMLSRSADRQNGNPDQRDWRIWGVDLREPH